MCAHSPSSKPVQDDPRVDVVNEFSDLDEIETSGYAFSQNEVTIVYCAHECSSRSAALYTCMILKASSCFSS